MKTLLQNEQENTKKTGKLFLVATPLGNADDLSPRAKQCLEDVDIILAEDSRRAGLAFGRWQIKNSRIISLNDHNENTKLDYVLNLLADGNNIALISDAGMPIISDPGYLLVKACREQKYSVTVIPGPSAPITALAGSGIAPLPFVFFGFLPRKKNEQEKLLAPYSNLDLTLIFFERKDRVEKTLHNIFSLLGNREVCIARELTKTHEEYIHFYLNNIPSLDHLLGELTVVIGQKIDRHISSEAEIMELIEKEIKFGGTLREVAKRVQVQSTGWKTGDIYALSTRNK